MSTGAQSLDWAFASDYFRVFLLDLKSILDILFTTESVNARHIAAVKALMGYHAVAATYSESTVNSLNTSNPLNSSNFSSSISHTSTISEYSGSQGSWLSSKSSGS